MILHIAPDDKFIDRAWSAFRSVRGVPQEMFVDVCPGKSLNYIKSPIAGNVGDAISLARRGGVTALVMHSLFVEDWATLLASCDPEVYVAWLGWGGDYLSLVQWALPGPAVLPRTRYSLRGMSGIALEMFVRLEPMFGLARRPSRELLLERIGAWPKEKIRNALSRIDGFSPVIPCEFGIAVRNGRRPWFSPERLTWRYPLPAPVLHAESGAQLAGPRESRAVVVGNSATSTNNHIEMFCILKKAIGREEVRVIAPLSYGDPMYGRFVKRAGERFFGDNFLAIDNFLPAEDYYRILRNSCLYMSNHIRQQAVGNIAAAVYLGVPVAIRPMSAVSRWFKKQGLPIVDSCSAMEVRRAIFCPDPVSGNAQARRTLEDLYFRQFEDGEDELASNLIKRVCEGRSVGR